MKTSIRYQFLFVMGFLLGSFGANSQITSTATPLPQLNKEFQVVAHIVMSQDSVPATTPATINAVMSIVNTYFSPIGVSFKVCEFDTIYNFLYHDTVSDDYVKEMVNQHYAPNRINIYYFNSFKAPEIGGKCYGSVAGGGYIGIKSNVSTVVAHELGHYFSLDHTFGNGPGTTSELVNGSNCKTTGDGICDTPADPYTVAAGEGTFIDPNDNCNYIYYGKDANGEYYNPDIANIMSYYSSCLGCPHFTHDQLLKMANYYLSTFNSSSKDRW